MKRDLSFLSSNLIAHRGYHDKLNGIPENSMKAFIKAIQNNYIIELDVHILKDGNVVVFHDDNLKRLTGIDKKLKNMNYDEIKNLKLYDTDEVIPLLTDVLKLVSGKVPLIIELKTDVKVGKLEREVLKILQSYEGKFCIKSFNPLSIYYIKRKNSHIIRGQLVSELKNEKMNKLLKIILSKMLFNFIVKPDFISCDIKFVAHKRIQKLRKNKVILGWTIRNKSNMEKAKKYCDNFIVENIDKII